MPFLPDDYKIPKTPGNYMRFEEGANRIRILSSAIVGWEYFNTDNKPIRSKEPFEDYPSDIKKDGKIKPFWAFVVWNYNDKRVQILEVVQKTIMTGLKTKIDNRKGKAQDYDFIITKTGEGLDSEYDVDVSDASPLAPDIEKAYKAKSCDLNALYIGADPFANSTPPTPLATRNKLTIELGDLPT